MSKKTVLERLRETARAPTAMRGVWISIDLLREAIAEVEIVQAARDHAAREAAEQEEGRQALLERWKDIPPPTPAEQAEIDAMFAEMDESPPIPTLQEGDEGTTVTTRYSGVGRIHLAGAGSRTFCKKVCADWQWEQPLTQELLNGFAKDLPGCDECLRQRAARLEVVRERRAFLERVAAAEDRGAHTSETANPCPRFEDAPHEVRAEYAHDPGEYWPPSCNGKWLHGSGGHRVHEGGCKNEPTWWHPDDCHAYCDEHIPERDKKFFALLWAKTRRAT